MSGRFRWVPPEPRPDALARPRLLRTLGGRWGHLVTSVVGGAGLGKTTLLAQAVAENRLAPRGEDVWVGVQVYDGDADRFARVVATALDRRAPDADPARHHVDDADLAAADDDAPPPSPKLVAGKMWQRSPAEVCLVLDDAHRLPAESTGATWLSDLIDELPANGHLLLSGRSEPPLPLDALERDHRVLRVSEAELRFTQPELTGFAERRGLDPALFRATGGWPALVELVACIDGRVAVTSLWESYLWEEVLDPLGPERRHVLATLCDLGGANDALASAALGQPIQLGPALDGVPLIAHDDAGWHAPHPLWRSAPGAALDTAERRQVRRRAVEHHVARGSFDEAFRLVQEAELWELAPTVLRGACLANDRMGGATLGRWLAVCPDDIKGSLAGDLAMGLHVAFTEPLRALELLERAVARCRAEDDIDGELSALSQIGRIAAWRRDFDMLTTVGLRLLELEQTGHPRARGLAAFSRAVAADVAGDDDQMRRELDSIRPPAGRAGDRSATPEQDPGAISIDPAWEMVALYMRVMLHLDLGEPEVATAEIERLRPRPAPLVRYVLDLLELRVRWTDGRFDDTLRRLPEVLAEARATGQPYHVYLGLSYGCLAFSQCGDVATARRCLEESSAAAPPPPGGSSLSVHSAVATASLLLAEGDEAGATATLRQARDDHGLDRGFERRGWRHTLPLTYVLLPESRAHWDALSLRGYLASSRDLAAAVVAGRTDSGTATAHLQALEVPDPEVVHGLLHHRLAAELALGLDRAGRPEGRAILDLLGPPGRAALRAVADTRPTQVKAARSLLAAVPAPPNRRTYLAVLGSLALRRDGPEGEEVVDGSLRRRRLQALVGFLVAHRRTTRHAITEALWPELDERRAANNLAVNLNHLLRVLEPWRDAREPSYLVRLEGQAVSLTTGEHLGVDVDDFEAHLAAVSRAESAGTPSDALEHLLAAVALYRDDLHVELPEDDWFALDRQHYRTRFVTAATRAGQLLVGRGDLDQAQSMARRALAVDPWSEDAYGVLVNAALAHDDRSAARRLLMHCLAALRDLDAQPSPATQQLRRRIQGLPTSDRVRSR